MDSTIVSGFDGIAELHIAGIVVYAHAKCAQRAATSIANLPGVVLHATNPQGKLVVTLEASSGREIAARIDEIQRLDSVLSASLVYQHHETLEKMMEEVSHEGHQTGLR